MIEDIKQKIQNRVAELQKIRGSVREDVRELFKKAMEENPNIRWISWTGTPNSYSDEGYACEGLLIISSNEHPNEDIDDQYGTDEHGDIPVGVWSGDKEDRRYNRETKRYEPIVFDDPLDNLARELYELVKPLADSVVDGLELTVSL